MTTRMAFLVPFLLLLAIHGASGARSILEASRIRMISHDEKYCAGWIANVALNNIQGWLVTPALCQAYIKNYMEGGQYLVDFGLAADAAGDLLTSLEPTDGKDAMVFDIDETMLSSLPYYRKHSYGGEKFNSTSFNQFVYTASAPALKPTLELYKKLQAKNWVLILITGRDEVQRDITIKNLNAAGFYEWNELILREPAYAGVAASIYKAAQRVELEKTKGYAIKSCIGDQWSDCIGPAAGNRTFKLPNPMYYIA